MEDHKPTSFTFEIDNFLEKEAVISSPTFSSGVCQWYANVYPKRKWRAKFSFVLLNQSGKEFYKSTELCQVFCAQVPGWGIVKALTIKKLQEKGFMEKNKLIVKVQVQILEVVVTGNETMDVGGFHGAEVTGNETMDVGGFHGAEVTGNETMDVGGFHVLYSQAFQVSWIFVRHPDTALNFRPKSHLVKTTYMNLLLKLIEKLDKPPHSFSETELSNTRTELVDLTQTGFKLDWLKEKLDVIYLERKKTADASRIQELEQHNKNLKAELNKEKIKSAASAAKVLWLEQTVSTLKTKPNKKLKLSPN
ncbi:hypothetical protein Bca4012_031544 [Brassica carinata]